MLKSKIRVRLAELELRQSQIFERYGVTQKQFSNWVTGQSYPRLEVAFKLAYDLGVKVDDLWEYKEE